MEDLEAGLLTECCELLTTISGYPENKKCFDCSDIHSPRYLCTTFSTFVCSCCANIHQEFGHKIKVLSVFAFTVNEIYVLKETGNRVASDKWLARWRPDLFNEPNPTSPTYKEDAREYIRAKYVEKRWVKLPPPIPIPVGGESTRGKGASVSPRGVAQVSPRGGVAEVSPRGVGTDADRFYEERSTLQQQHDADKSTSHPVLTDASHAPPLVYQYVSQPMYIPMPLQQSQYGYHQYPVPMEMSHQLPPSYYSRSPMGVPQPYLPTLCSYPFDNSRMPMIEEGISWPGAKRREKLVLPSVSHRSLRPLPIAEDAQPTGILRSVSDTSLSTAAARQTLKEECTGACKCSSCAQISNKRDTKLKIQGMMSKMTGLLPKKRMS